MYIAISQITIVFSPEESIFESIEKNEKFIISQISERFLQHFNKNLYILFKSIHQIAKSKIFV